MLIVLGAIVRGDMSFSTSSSIVINRRFKILTKTTQTYNTHTHINTPLPQMIWMNQPKPTTSSINQPNISPNMLFFNRVNPTLAHICWFVVWVMGLKSLCLSLSLSNVKEATRHRLPHRWKLPLIGVARVPIGNTTTVHVLRKLRLAG